MNFNKFLSISTEFDEFSAEGGTKRPQLELAITRCFEVDFQKLGHFWKAESQGFPTATIRASEDLTCSSYERFEIVPPPAGFIKMYGIVARSSSYRAAFGGNIFPYIPGGLGI